MTTSLVNCTPLSNWCEGPTTPWTWRIRGDCCMVTGKGYHTNIVPTRQKHWPLLQVAVKSHSDGEADYSFRELLQGFTTWHGWCKRPRKFSFCVPLPCTPLLDHPTPTRYLVFWMDPLIFVIFELQLLTQLQNRLYRVMAFVRVTAAYYDKIIYEVYYPHTLLMKHPL